MSPEQSAALVGVLIGGVVGLAVGSLISAVILRAAAQWAEKLEIPFGAAYVTVLLSGIANFIVSFVLGAGAGAAAPGNHQLIYLVQAISVVVGFVIQASIISARHNVSFGKAAKIEFFMFLIGLMIGIVIAVIVVGAMLLFGLLSKGH